MTDAIQAGQGPAEMIVALGEKLIKPLLFFYFVWPMISKALFDP
jgi:hypothetical protein